MNRRAIFKRSSLQDTETTYIQVDLYIYTK